LYAYLRSGTLACNPLLRSDQPTIAPNPYAVSIHLEVPPGTPLRLYLLRRTWFREGVSVSAQLIEPLWAFDHIMVPVRTAVRGRISSLNGVSGAAPAKALLNGDFTPPEQAQVVFTDMRFPDGPIIRIDTLPAIGLSTIYMPIHNGVTKEAQKTSEDQDGFGPTKS
jgi:hypothetical protein